MTGASYDGRHDRGSRHHDLEVSPDGASGTLRFPLPCQRRLRTGCGQDWLSYSDRPQETMACPPTTGGRRGRFAVVVLCLMVRVAAADTLSLAQAEEIALRNNPKIGSAGLVAQAAEKQITEARAASRPTLNGFLTGTGAETGTAVAAGALTTSSISNRAASGMALSQMITDFGRTSNLTKTAKLRAAAQGKNVVTSRAQVILEVREAYFQALGADSAASVAKTAVDARSTTLRQIRALVQAQVNSTLDLSFAEVAVSEAELTLYQAQNDAREARARLSAAMGYSDEQNFTPGG